MQHTRKTSTDHQQHVKRPKKKRKATAILKNTAIVAFIIGFIISGSFLIWISSLDLPDLDNFIERKVSSSSKIYDNTGEIVLYDIHENIQRIAVDYEEISPKIINAFVAIEDQKFYTHKGIDIKATARAIYYTALKKLGIKKDAKIQGGSTITQQVIKNTLLTSQKTISRKIKEWVLAIKLEKKLGKKEIMEYYLNEVPYGGSMYGVEQGSIAFFSKSADEVSLAEAAYLAAIPNAPTFYSPYGQNIEKLEQRKNKVLKEMYDMGFINKNEYIEALNEKITFRNKNELNAKAIHFVEYVRQQVEEILGTDSIETEGLTIITTLDYDLQKKAEEIVWKRALENQEKYNASNQSLVAIDSKTGAVLSMVGSRDYNDEEIDGKYNVAIAKRQPGSSFKPIVYATMFEKGYTDKTILFDTQTQFHEGCDVDEFTKDDNPDCYSPRNYDNLFKGPFTIRNALAQSRNVPAVKATYIAGIYDSVKTARNLGITTLTDPSRYGLTLVLGGGEVKLLEMVGAYSVFANDGVKNETHAIKQIINSEGETIYEHKNSPKRVLKEQTARLISDILKDNQARTPLFGANSFFYFGPDTDIAGKTGTTQNNKDAWVIGYSSSITVGVWSGNNDNTPMKKGSSISGPAWRDFMNYAIKEYPAYKFKKPADSTTGKPFIDGIWFGGEFYEIDKISGKLATEHTPPETRVKITIPNVHSILHWVNRNNPLGPPPQDPSKTWSLYNHFEYGVQKWIEDNGYSIFNSEVVQDLVQKPEEYDDVHIPENFPQIRLPQNITSKIYTYDDTLSVKPFISSKYPVEKVEYYINDTLHTIQTDKPFSANIVLDDYITDETIQLKLKIVAIDKIFNRGTTEATLKIGRIN